MRTRLGRLPDGRIFCGYVLTQNCCRAIYTHSSVFASEVIKHRQTKTNCASFYNGKLNQVELYTSDNSQIGSQWYMPSLAEAVLLLNLTGGFISDSSLDSIDRNLVYGIIQSPTMIVNAPSIYMGIIPSSTADRVNAVREDGTIAETFRYTAIRGGVESCAVSVIVPTNLGYRSYLVQSARVEL